MNPVTFETQLTTVVEKEFAQPNKRTTFAVDGSPYVRIMPGEVYPNLRFLPLRRQPCLDIETERDVIKHATPLSFFSNKMCWASGFLYGVLNDR